MADNGGRTPFLSLKLLATWEPRRGRRFFSRDQRDQINPMNKINLINSLNK